MYKLLYKIWRGIYVCTAYFKILQECKTDGALDQCQYALFSLKIKNQMPEYTSF